jgi:hypothetical protein
MPGGKDGDKAQTKDQKELPKNKNTFQKEVTLVPDSQIVIQHGKKSKRLLFSARDQKGRKVEVKWKTVDENKIKVWASDSMSVKLSITPKEPLENQWWYNPAQQAARFLYGNMGRYNAFHVDARLEGQTYWRNYSDIVGGMNAALQTAAKRMDNRSAESIYAKLALGRLHFVRFYTDYEPRNPDSTMVEEQYRADATLEMVPIAADGRQVVRRDRHIYLDGFSEPARFYQPDYSQQQPQQPADYRRTLYWNPNAVSDEEGRFTATFYNNARETRIGISAAGVTPDGRLLHSK